VSLKPGAFHSGQFGHIVWTTWTATRATGSAVLWANNCKPYCAAGTYYPAPGTLVASRVRNGVYTRLVLTFTAGSSGFWILTHLKPGPNGYVW
jgi:hypothetical protein